MMFSIPTIFVYRTNPLINPLVTVKKSNKNNKITNKNPAIPNTGINSNQILEHFLQFGSAPSTELYPLGQWPQILPILP